MTVAGDALPTRDAVIARRILAADLSLLADLDDQISSAETALTVLLPRSAYATLTTVPGWGVVRVSNYAAALGDPTRWPGPRQIYRASGLSPMQYESAHKRRDGAISREGSVALRRALIDLGVGLRPSPSRHPHRLRTGARPRRLRPHPLVLTLPTPVQRKDHCPYTPSQPRSVDAKLT